MRRIEARRKNAKALRVRFSKSLANRRHRFEPGEGAFNNPTPWENLEAFGVIRALDDFDLEVRKRFGQSLLKGRPLISTIGEELFQEGKHPEQGRENKHACVAVLNIGRMYDRMKQEP